MAPLAQGQFQITYRHGIELSDHHPDFVAELGDRIVMLELKSNAELDDPVVLAKKDAAVEWCRHATAALDAASAASRGSTRSSRTMPFSRARRSTTCSHATAHPSRRSRLE